MNNTDEKNDDLQHWFEASSPLRPEADLWARLSVIPEQFPQQPAVAMGDKMWRPSRRLHDLSPMVKTLWPEAAGLVMAGLLGIWVGSMDISYLLEIITNGSQNNFLIDSGGYALFGEVSG
ncbi:MAG: hypothetical protein CMF31_02325 [Kordiimonas sp.]|nr:hypothetical protein [Kordiimonas sp.]